MKDNLPLEIIKELFEKTFAIQDQLTDLIDILGQTYEMHTAISLCPDNTEN